MKTLIFISLYVICIHTLNPGTLFADDGNLSAKKAYSLSEADSIRLYSLPEVVIERSRHSFFYDDRKVSHPDTLITEVFFAGDAGSLISLFTPSYVNTSGGVGSSSALFFRGTNSYQTTVNWNGFPLNSLSLGTADLSLIPVAATDEISVVHGSSGSIAGSGNAGSSVLLKSRADWDNRLMANARSEIGTFGDRHFSLSGKTGNPHLQYHLHLFSHQAENDFTYNDTYKPGSPRQTAGNNSMNNAGIIQNLFVRLAGNNMIEAGMWYQSRIKELPAIMGSYQPSSAVQRDSTLRVYARWTKRWSASALTVNTAMFDEFMIFKDKNNPADLQWSIDSRIRTGKLLGELNYRVDLTGFLTLDAGLELSSLSADVSSYGGKVNEQRAAAMVGAKLRWQRFAGNVTLRQEYHDGIEVPLQFSAGLTKSLPVKGLSIRSAWSSQFRVPTFNDRFWQPGGNPLLKPESGFTIDGGIMQEINTEKGPAIAIDVSPYISFLNDMIQWVPTGSSTWWTPENRNSVRIKGLETSLSATGDLGRYAYSARLAYNTVRSETVEQVTGGDEVRSKLMYVPSNRASAMITASTPGLFFGAAATFTGKRYTSNDNDPAYQMPSFAVANAWAGYRLYAGGGVHGRIQLRVMNILNSNYQVIRSYPMPGRSFHLGFSLELNSR